MMSKIVAIHSFRRGAGKSVLTANIAALLAATGRRIGVVDADLHAPALHIHFGLDESQTTYLLNDYLEGKCDLGQAVYDVTPDILSDAQAKILLVPASTKLSEISRVLREGYDIEVFNEGLRRLIVSKNLDMLVLDTCAGLSEDTLLPIAISDTLVLILRPDQLDYQGTAVTVDIASKLEVPRVLLVTNMVPPSFDFKEVKAEVEKTYQREVVAVLPYSDEMMAFASRGIFVLHHPKHPVTATLRQITDRIVKD